MRAITNSISMLARESLLTRECSIYMHILNTFQLNNIDSKISAQSENPNIWRKSIHCKCIPDMIPDEPVKRPTNISIANIIHWLVLTNEMKMV